MTQPTVALPTIHLNGTSQDHLLDGVVECERAVQTAIRALETNGPNARDYYVQGPDAFTRARKEHDDRIARLKTVSGELFALADGIAGGGHKIRSATGAVS